MGLAAKLHEPHSLRDVGHRRATSAALGSDGFRSSPKPVLGWVADDILDWRDGPHEDLVLALASAMREAKWTPGLLASISHRVADLKGLAGV